MSLDLDPKPNCNPDPDPNPNPNHNPDIPPVPDPKALLSLSFYKVDILFLAQLEMREPGAVTGSPSGPSVGLSLQSWTEEKGDHLLWSPSPSWQVLGAAGPALSCCVRRCDHYSWRV